MNTPDYHVKLEFDAGDKLMTSGASVIGPLLRKLSPSDDEAFRTQSTANHHFSREREGHGLQGQRGRSGAEAGNAEHGGCGSESGDNLEGEASIQANGKKEASILQAGRHRLAQEARRPCPGGAWVLQPSDEGDAPQRGIHPEVDQGRGRALGHGRFFAEEGHAFGGTKVSVKLAGTRSSSW